MNCIVQLNDEMHESGGDTNPIRPHRVKFVMQNKAKITKTLKFFLNEAELSLNSVNSANSGKLLNC